MNRFYKKIWGIILGVGVFLLLTAASNNQKQDIPKKVSKISVSKAREKAVEAVVGLLKSIHEIRISLDLLEKKLFDSLCSFFEDKEDELIMSKQIDQIVCIEQSAASLELELQRLLNKNNFSL